MSVVIGLLPVLLLLVLDSIVCRTCICAQHTHTKTAAAAARTTTLRTTKEEEEEEEEETHDTGIQ